MKTILVSLALLLAASATLRAHFHHVIPMVVKAPKPSPQSFGGGGAWCTGGCVWVGGFIAAVAGAIIVHEILGPACANPGNKNGYDSPTLWRPLCNWKDPAQTAVYSK